MEQKPQHNYRSVSQCYWPRAIHVNFKHLTDNETLAMKTEKTELSLNYYLLLDKKKKTFSLQRSHSVQLIKNTCDFLLKQLGIFFRPRSRVQRKMYNI